MGIPLCWPRDTPLSANDGTKIRQSVAVEESVQFTCWQNVAEFVFVRNSFSASNHFISPVAPQSSSTIQNWNNRQIAGHSSTKTDSVNKKIPVLRNFEYDSVIPQIQASDRHLFISSSDEWQLLLKLKINWYYFFILKVPSCQKNFIVILSSQTQIRVAAACKFATISSVTSMLVTTVALAVSRPYPTAVAHIQFRFKLCGSCGGQSGTETCSLWVLRFPLPLIHSTDCSTILTINYPGLVQQANKWPQW
jgi:hypothetical protein